MCGTVCLRVWVFVSTNVCVYTVSYLVVVVVVCVAVCLYACILLVYMHVQCISDQCVF